MTLDGPHAGDPVLTSDELTEGYRQIMFTHADDPMTGACVLCGSSLCPEFRWARQQLIVAGLPLTKTAAQTHTGP